MIRREREKEGNLARIGPLPSQKTFTEDQEILNVITVISLAIMPAIFQEINMLQDSIKATTKTGTMIEEEVMMEK